jgi:hypothetical protein
MPMPIAALRFMEQLTLTRRENGIKELSAIVRGEAARIRATEYKERR